MKNFLFLLLFISCTTTLFAQEDRFTNVNQTKGKEIYITDNSSLDVVFTINDGKVKRNKKINTIAGKVFSVEENFYTYKNKNYIVLKGENEIILFNEDDSPLYLSSFVSKSYWKEKYDLYKKDYIYIDFKKYNQIHPERITIEYDDLTRIEWQGLEPTENGANFYMCEFDGINTYNKFKVTSKFFEEFKDVYFIKKDNIKPYVEKYNARLAQEKREKEISDSINNSKLRLATALYDMEFSEENSTINIHKGDTLAIFSYDPSREKFIARFQYSNLLLNPEKIHFLDTGMNLAPAQNPFASKETKKEQSKYSADEEYLRAKGEDGKEMRFNVAADYDDIQTAKFLNKLKSTIEELEKEIAFKKKNQIFLTGIGYEFDSSKYSNRYGMRFDVYNCFNKTIKYVEFTLTNYNAVGDVQRDDIGRSSRTVRGIGPIEPGEGGRYSWDDIFWDDRDVISRTSLTNVKFTFMDGTTRVFSGTTNIRKHMTADAWE